MDDPGFTDMVSLACQRHLESLCAQRPLETLAGYALCTDDDLSTLYGVAVTHEFARAAPDPVVRYIAVEWPYGHRTSLFDEAQLQIEQRYVDASSGGAIAPHVERTFACLVQALRRLRERALVRDDVLLLVASSDPGPALEALAARGARALNAPLLFDAWRDAMGYAP